MWQLPEGHLRPSSLSDGGRGPVGSDLLWASGPALNYLIPIKSISDCLTADLLQLDYQMWLWGIGLFIMLETKGGNAEQLKQQSFLLPQRLLSKEVITKQAPRAGRALRCGSMGKGKKEGIDRAGRAQVIPPQPCRARVDVSTLHKSSDRAQTGSFISPSSRLYGCQRVALRL